MSNLDTMDNILSQNIIAVIEKSTLSDPEELRSAKKRLVLKLLNLACNEINHMNFQSIIDDPDIIDEDMFTCGSIEGDYLHIDISPINIKIDLQNVICNAMLHKKYNVIHLLIGQNVDLYKLEPRIMIMCVDTSADDMLQKLIEIKIPIHVENYRCVYQLAANGNLNLIKEILKTYQFQNIIEIVAKICVQASIHNHVDIIEYFFTPESFTGAPEQVFVFFLNSIQYRGNLPIIKFFIDNGINIKRDNYAAVRAAVKYNRSEVLQYFYLIEPTIIDLLSDEQKEQFNLVPVTRQNQYIGLDTSCNIYYDDIAEGDGYYRCSNKKHYFKEEA